MKLSVLQTKLVAWLLLVSCINCWMGCSRYYKPTKAANTSDEEKTRTIKEQKQASKTFILRQGNKSFLMENVTINEAATVVTTNLTAVPPEHQVYINKRRNLRYIQSRGEQTVLTEAHVFVNDRVEADSGRTLTLQMGDIEKMEIIKHDEGKTSTSYILTGLLTTLGIGAALILIIAATKESCPYVSVYNEGKFELQGELFGGAIYPSLQREDYVPLRINASNGEYTVKISNELQERQYTDIANLVVVEHDPALQVLADPSGTLNTVAQPQLPIASVMNDVDISTSLRYKDDISCVFDDVKAANNISHIELTFKNQNKHNKGKLLLSVRNSYWFDYLYGQFTKGFGSHYEKWISQQKAKPAAELKQWINEQNIPLTVSVKYGNEWREVKKINTVGPLLNREILLPIDIPSNQAVEVRLSTGFMFWELDYVAIDYSENAAISIKEVQPYKAVNEREENVLPQLTSADKKYLHQPNIGDATVLTYKSPTPSPGLSQTVILHTSGYYEHVRDYKGVPKIAFLNKFKKAGHFASFSKEKYVEIKKQQTALAKTH